MQTFCKTELEFCMKTAIPLISPPQTYFTNFDIGLILNDQKHTTIILQIWKYFKAVIINCFFEKKKKILPPKSNEFGCQL